MTRSLREIRDRIDQLIQEEEKTKEFRVMTLEEIEEEAAGLSLEVRQAVVEMKLKAAQQAAFSPSGSPDPMSSLRQKQRAGLGRHRKPKAGA